MIPRDVKVHCRRRRRQPPAAGDRGVIDKDLCSERLARQLAADFLVMATDANAVFLDRGKLPRRRCGVQTQKPCAGMGFPWVKAAPISKARQETPHGPISSAE
jgi:hypothetical protein